MRRVSKKKRPAAAPDALEAGRCDALPMVDHLLRETDMDAPGSGFSLLKRLVDCVCAAIIAVPAIPIALAAIALVRLTSRGPAIYSQERVGYGGRRFTIYKIRTMMHDCESLTGPKWCVPGDPRVTPIGRLLRKLHIDELPQLFNVIRGDMSLVGPRPERPVFVAKLSRKIPLYPGRHAVPPGITGLAQLTLPPDIEVEDVERKLKFDLHYARTSNLWLDLWILMCTGLKVVGVPRGAIRSVLPQLDEPPQTLPFPSAGRRSRAA